MVQRGWFKESYRHSLAARGVSTRAYFSRKQERFRGYHTVKVARIPIRVERPHAGTQYPIAPRDAEAALRRNGAAVKGLSAVTFANPRTDAQRDAWAQYVRRNREIKVFAQPKCEVTPESHELVKGKVFDHETGHHEALYRRKITDGDVRVAEARADAYAAGGDVADEQFVKKFL
jgi:hypothetical protein